MGGQFFVNSTVKSTFVNILPQIVHSLLITLSVIYVFNGVIWVWMGLKNCTARYSVGNVHSFSIKNETLFVVKPVSNMW